MVNLWPKRLIGDANLPEDCEIAVGGGRGGGGGTGPGAPAGAGGAAAPAGQAGAGGPGGAGGGSRGLQQNISNYPQWLLDGKPSPTGRFTFSIIRVWAKDAPLRKSGLLGPVILHAAARVSS